MITRKRGVRDNQNQECSQDADNCTPKKRSKIQKEDDSPAKQQENSNGVRTRSKTPKKPKTVKKSSPTKTPKRSASKTKTKIDNENDRQDQGTAGDGSQLDTEELNIDQQPQTQVKEPSKQINGQKKKIILKEISVDHDGDVQQYKAGQYAFVVLNLQKRMPELYSTPLCTVCGKEDYNNGKNSSSENDDGDSDEEEIQLECSMCLSMCHAQCVGIHEVPEQDYICDSCTLHDGPIKRPCGQSLEEAVVTEHGIGLVWIKECYTYQVSKDKRRSTGSGGAQSGDGGQMVSVVWMYPLHQVRHAWKNHHHKMNGTFPKFDGRQVFQSLLIETDVRAAALLQRANVLRASEFNDPNAQLGRFDFWCEVCFDQQNNSFSPWRSQQTLWTIGTRRNKQRAKQSCQTSGPSGPYDPDYLNNDDSGCSSDEDGVLLDDDEVDEGWGGGRRGGKQQRGKLNKQRNGVYKLKQGGLLRGSGGLQSDQLSWLLQSNHGRNKPCTTDAFTLASYQLQLATVPDEIPCRSQEKASLKSWIEDYLDSSASGSGSCMYIAGVPGTGKTACVIEVVRGIYEQYSQKQDQPFKVCMINGGRLHNVNQCYSTLLFNIEGVKMTANKALARLEQLFQPQQTPQPRGRKKQGDPNSEQQQAKLIVILDELDLLKTRDCGLLYNLFNWPYVPGSQLCVIGISNTMDLPERLMPRVASRVSSRKLLFSPYKSEDLYSILQQRLHGVPLFDKQAIKLTAKKVGACSGDVRRMLQLASRALDIAESQHQSRASLAPPPSTAHPTTTTSAGRQTTSTRPSPKATPPPPDPLPAKSAKQTTDQRSTACSSTHTPRVNQQAPFNYQTPYDQQAQFGVGVRDPGWRVTTSHVSMASTDMFGVPHIYFLQQLAGLHQAFLLAVMQVCRITGVPYCTVEQATDRLFNQARQTDVVPADHVNTTSIWSVINNLTSLGLVEVEGAWRVHGATVRLGVMEDDVLWAMQGAKGGLGKMMSQLDHLGQIAQADWDEAEQEDSLTEM